jgi:hypothetical protein
MFEIKPMEELDRNFNRETERIRRNPDRRVILSHGVYYVSIPGR